MRARIALDELISLSFQSLKRRPGRTILSVVSVLIAVCSIVIMVSLGIAMNQTTEQMIGSFGNLTEINVMPGNSNETQSISDEALSAIEAYPDVQIATPYEYTSINAIVTAADGRYETHFTAVGVYAAAPRILGCELSGGEYLPGTSEYLGEGKIPVLVSDKYAFGFQDTKRSHASADRRAAYELAQDGSYIGTPFVDVQNDRLTLNLIPDEGNTASVISYELVVVGIIKTDSSQGLEYPLLINISDLKSIEKRYYHLNETSLPENFYGYTNVIVKVSNLDSVNEIQMLIENMGYQTNSLNSTREEVQESSRQSQLILGGIGMIAVLVSAIGISNTMIMNVHERTKEIGILKVLGFQSNHIRCIFLLESSMIGLGGGFSGIFLSYLISYFVNVIGLYFLNNGPISSIPWWLALFGITVSVVIGMLAGIAPANKATSISALKAIRYE